jgi:hypothetical protein
VSVPPAPERLRKVQKLLWEAKQDLQHQQGAALHARHELQVCGCVPTVVTSSRQA